MAALWAAGIDTGLVTVDGNELPNQDGSSLPIYEVIERAGRIQAAPRAQLGIDEPLRVEDEGSYLQIEPADILSIDYAFCHPELGEQRYSAEVSREMSVGAILPARSFITDKEAAAAKAAGYLHNDNVEDALVLHVTAGNVLPAAPLRFPDEFARHKVLDLLGDLYLAPFEWTGKVTAFRSGHRLNRAMARKLAELARNGGC
jgi:UDP-3-O-acyl-N-acetylglucosamine deacetylase